MADLLRSRHFLDCLNPTHWMLCLCMFILAVCCLWRPIAPGYVILKSFHLQPRNGTRCYLSCRCVHSTEIRSLLRLFSNCYDNPSGSCISKWLTGLNDFEAFSAFNARSLTTATNPLSIHGISHWHFCGYLPSFWYYQVDSWKWQIS